MLPALIDVIGMYALYRRGVRSTQIAAAADPMPTPTRLWPVLLRFAIATLALLVLGHPFATSAAQLAELSGLGHSFVGTVQVGLSTALPERVASITAWRIGASGLAAGNVFDKKAVPAQPGLVRRISGAPLQRSRRCVQAGALKPCAHR